MKRSLVYVVLLAVIITLTSCAGVVKNDTTDTDTTIADTIKGVKVYIESLNSALESYCTLSGKDCTDYRSKYNGFLSAYTALEDVSSSSYGSSTWFLNAANLIFQVMSFAKELGVNL